MTNFRILLLLILLPLAPAAPPDIQAGYFSQYAEGPTVDTLWYRQEVSQELPADLSHYQVYLAPFVGVCNVGDVGWIRPEAGEWERFIVYDCPGHASGVEWARENNIIGEIDFYTAARWDTIGRGVRGEIMWLEAQ